MVCVYYLPVPWAPYYAFAIHPTNISWVLILCQALCQELNITFLNQIDKDFLPEYPQSIFLNSFFLKENVKKIHKEWRAIKTNALKEKCMVPWNRAPNQGEREGFLEEVAMRQKPEQQGWMGWGANRGRKRASKEEETKFSRFCRMKARCVDLKGR